MKSFSRVCFTGKVYSLTLVSKEDWIGVRRFQTVRLLYVKSEKTIFLNFIPDLASSVWCATNHGDDLVKLFFAKKQTVIENLLLLKDLFKVILSLQTLIFQP